MAIVQISRIQHRRGLQQDLPNLASAELGWSLDERRLYIGNGTLEEGAPTEGITEILTEYTDFIGLISSYTFKGTEAGYTSVTGASALSPIVRTLQNVLDESISVRSFGAVGDGTTNDTAAINRAIRQVYVSSLSTTYNSIRRTIRFPAGNYRITSNLVIPPNCTLVGDGKNNSIITSNVGVIQTCDSLFQISSSIGTGGAIPPGNITIRDMSLTTSSTINPVAYINKATNVLLNSVNFTGGSYNVTLAESSAVEVSSSTFAGATAGTFDITGSDGGLISRSNYFDTIRTTLATGTTTSITTLANGAGKIDYEITSGTNYRIGTIKYNRSGGVCTFDDEYSEPAASIGANLWVRSNGAVICAVGSTSTLKYNIKQFI
jgi:hypothetical protein